MSSLSSLPKYVSDPTYNSQENSFLEDNEEPLVEAAQVEATNQDEDKDFVLNEDKGYVLNEDRGYVSNEESTSRDSSSKDPEYRDKLLEILPPLEGIYTLKEASREAIRGQTYRYRYELVIVGSKKVRNNSTRRTTFRYRRRGKTRDYRKLVGRRQRRTTIYKRGCLIRLYEFAYPDGLFTIKYVIGETSKFYSYPPNSTSNLEANQRRYKRSEALIILVRKYIQYSINIGELLLLVNKKFLTTR